MGKIIFFVVFLFSLPSYGKISCTLEESGCETIKGMLTSKTVDGKYTSIYLNGTEIKKIEARDVITAFAYYGLTTDSVVGRKKRKPSRLILSYTDDYGCISDIDKIRCVKIFLVDLSEDNIIMSNEINPPVPNAMMMDVDWKKNAVIMRFEDHSQFIYENGQINMLDDGSILRQAEKDEEESLDDKNNSIGTPQPDRGVATILGKLNFYGDIKGHTDVVLDGETFFTIEGDFYNDLFINPIMNNEVDKDKRIIRMVMYASILKGCQYPEDFTRCHVYYLLDFSGSSPVGAGPMYTANPDAVLRKTKWNDIGATQIGFSDGTLYVYDNGKLIKTKKGVKD